MGFKRIRKNVALHPATIKKGEKLVNKDPAKFKSFSRMIEIAIDQLDTVKLPKTDINGHFDTSKGCPFHKGFTDPICEFCKKEGNNADSQ